MSKNTALKEHDSHELDSNSTMERGDCELAEVEDFWQPRMRVWSDRKISENKVVRMYGMVTGSLTRLIVPADSPNSPAIPTLRVRVRWDGLESDVLLHPDEVVPYTELTTAEPKTFVQEASQTIVQETLVATVDVLAQVLTGAEARQYADFDGLGTIKDASPISARITPMPGSASPSSRKVFDYASLDAGTSQFVQQQTGEIRVLMKRTAQGIIEVGQKLIEVKEKLGHGRFGEWLEAEFAWSDFTARQFMNVAKLFRFENFSDLNIAPSALYELAAPSTPEAARSEALARAEAGEPITYTAAKAIKQKHKLPRPPKPELEPASQAQLTPIPAPPPQLGSKLEIRAIRPQGQAPTRTPQDIREEATRVMVPQSAPTHSVQESSQPVKAPGVPGAWWRLGGRHLLYCGDPNSPEFLARITKEVELVQLLLAFPSTVDWQPAIRARARLIVEQYLPQGKNLDQFDEILESNILFYSHLNDMVVSCFLPEPEIISIVNRLERRGLFAEPDERCCKAVIADWKKAGLKVERFQ